MSTPMRNHGYHALTIAEIVHETADTRTFVFDVPADLHDTFAYRAGQFCTVRATIGDDEVLRCYSMSSAPAVDADLAVTVKRVPGGVMSGWLHDHLAVGDTLELMPPSGVFCPGDGDGPIVGFCGGSGVTPVFSIVKHALVTTGRRVKLLDANRDRQSVIFGDAFDALATEYPDRFELLHHLDVDGGYLRTETVTEFIEGADGAEMFICGPGPFMDLVETALVDAGVDRSQIAIERFALAMPADVGTNATAGPDTGAADTGAADTGAADTGAAGDRTETLTLILKRKTHTFDYMAGDTVLDAARRAGLKPPFSCELGNCASCMALVTNGGATMRTNNALSADEVAEGWVLTCQSLPIGAHVTIEYEDF